MRGAGKGSEVARYVLVGELCVPRTTTQGGYVKLDVSGVYERGQKRTGGRMMAKCSGGRDR